MLRVIDGWLAESKVTRQKVNVFVHMCAKLSLDARRDAGTNEK